ERILEQLPNRSFGSWAKMLSLVRGEARRGKLQGGNDLRAMIDGSTEGAGGLDALEPAPRGRNPFPVEGIERDDRGVRRYVDRPRSLVAMLRASTERRDG